MAVYKDEKRGTYFFAIRVNGKQIKRRGFKTSRAAKMAEAEFMLGVDDSDNPSFKYVANEYKSWYKKRRKPMSIKKMEGIVDNYLLPTFGNKNINDIKNRDVIKFHDSLIGVNSLSTNKTIHVFLSAVFNFAIKNEYTIKNPANAVGNFEGNENKRMDYWALDEFKAFMDVVDEFVYYVLFMVLYYSGMRKGEALALTWSDVDMENNIINISKTHTKSGVNSTKTGATRNVIMPYFVIRLLTQLKAQNDPKMNYVVFGEFYNPLGETTLSKRFNKWIKKSGVKKIRIHDLRHSHASYLINKGTVITVVSHRLGHSNTSTTWDVYSHLYPSTEKEAISDMENDFKKADIIKLLP